MRCEQETERGWTATRNRYRLVPPTQSPGPGGFESCNMFRALSEPDVDTEDAGQFPILDGAPHSVASGAVTFAIKRKIGPMKKKIAQRLRKKERQSSQPFAVEGVEDSDVEVPVNKWWNGEDKHQSPYHRVPTGNEHLVRKHCGVGWFDFDSIEKSCPAEVYAVNFGDAVDDVESDCPWIDEPVTVVGSKPTKSERKLVPPGVYINIPIGSAENLGDNQAKITP